MPGADAKTKKAKPLKAKKKWTGEKRSGPPAARHIPWPEIFKHHISVVEGHLRMVEMIQKHTTPGTGNYHTIHEIVKRSQEMLTQSKTATRSFIPPPGQREKVPLGSSSASMYPGYSPEDIEYGAAASEAGQAIGQLRKQGIEWEGPANGAEYKIGQARGDKRKTQTLKANGEILENADVSMTDATPEEAKDAEQQQEEAIPAFFIDTKPTPVALSTEKSKVSKKRAREDDPDSSEIKKSKKEKREEKIVVETEDISAEVDEILRKKEEKAKAKEEKKRRKSSGDDSESISKKSKKDKSKKRDAEDIADEAGDGEEKKKKKRKKRDSSSE